MLFVHLAQGTIFFSGLLEIIGLTYLLANHGSFNLVREGQRPHSIVINTVTYKAHYALIWWTGRGPQRFRS